MLFPIGEGNGSPLHYSCLENPMDREAWRATVRGAAKSRTRLRNEATTTISNIKNLKSLQDFPGSTVDKNLSANARDTGSTPGLGRFHTPPIPTKPIRHNYGACAPQQEMPLQGEVCAPRWRVTATHCNQIKATLSNKDPVQPKRKKKF